ncbi:MAG TPA: hypothetical protein VN609_08360, partial [Propionibacteriaceae bacterium]|nr:hypothetical protein [Propionibacteriaceae bacterium]
MSTADFTAAYDGEALKDHRIDVRDLAPALLAFGQLFEEANELLNRDRAQVRVKVRATGEGSFAIDLEVVQTIGRQVEGFLTGNHVTAALNLKELLIGGSIGLFALIKRMRGRKPTKLSDSSDGVL